MISVIIPLYNKESYIEETLKSVINQSFKDFEVIIVNDGSTDNSINMAKRIEDTRIRVVSIKNSGVSVARNTGINMAQYSWIALLDGDDWWSPSFLAEMVMAIKTFPNEVLFASGRSRVFNTEIERYDHRYLPLDGTTEKLNYFKVITKYLPLINSSNVIIKRSHFENAGYFRVGQKQHEDHDLWMRLAINKQVVFVNKNLSFYRKIVLGSASGMYYRALDFLRYLRTIKEVNDGITDENKIYLKEYANNFALITYIKNYGQFTSEEKTLLSKPMKSILKGTHRFMFFIIEMLPINVYPILKKLKK